MWAWCRYLVQVGLILTAACIGTQAPEFFQQYTQRLAGHHAELKTQLRVLEFYVKHSGRALQEYIFKFLSHHDPDVQFQGNWMEEMVKKEQRLEKALSKIRGASPLTRPFVFVRHLEGDIARATMADFKPALPMTLEGSLYAVTGGLLGEILFLILDGILKWIPSKRRIA